MFGNRKLYRRNSINGIFQRNFAYAFLIRRKGALRFSERGGIQHMDLKQKADELSYLAAMMKKTGLTRLEYTEGDFQIKLEIAPQRHKQLQSSAAPCTENEESGTEAPAAAAEVTNAICSPIVGTVYLAPGPGQENYVSVGDSVAVGDVVCIIESMKLLNEIKAEKSGVITEICVQNEDVVECNQPLFMIRDFPEA